MNARTHNLKLLSLSAVAGVMMIASGSAVAMEAQSGADTIGHGGAQVTYEGPYGKSWPANVKTTARTSDAVTHAAAFGRHWPSPLVGQDSDA